MNLQVVKKFKNVETQSHSCAIEFHTTGILRDTWGPPEGCGSMLTAPARDSRRYPQGLTN